VESLGEILKKNLSNTIEAGSTDTSSSTDPGVYPEGHTCPICQGIGYLRRDVPAGHPDFGRLVPCQCKEAERAERRLGRLQRLTNLGALRRLTFDSLMPEGLRPEPELRKRFRLAYQVAQEFADAPEGWLVLSGVSGCGKTHLAAAIANRRLDKGAPALFVVVPDLLDHLRAAFGPQSDVDYDDLFEAVRASPLLILDDLGTQSNTPWAQEKLFQLINARYNERRPTVITTNVPPEHLDERLRMRLTDPSLSRVLPLVPSASPSLDRLGSMDLPLLREMTFHTFQVRDPGWDAETQANLRNALQLARTFAETPDGWLVLLGRFGCGKTHLAAAIANYCRAQGKDVFFVVVPDLLDYLRSTFAPDSRVTYDALFEAVRTAPLLILDDLGTQSSTFWAQEKLYQLVNYRYNAALPTVFTTSQKMEDLDGRLASRMVDQRLAKVFEIIAPDYRGGRHVAAKPAAKSRGTSAPRKRG
jgi:DNA replication protein DnaC